MNKLKMISMAIAFTVAIGSAFAFMPTWGPCDGSARLHYTGIFANPNDDPNVATKMPAAEVGYSCILPSAVCTYYFDGQIYVPCPDDPLGTYTAPLK